MAAKWNHRCWGEDIFTRDTDARSPHSSNIFSSYSHNLCLIGINPFSGSLWSQSPVRPLGCLTKLWNGGVRLRDERRDADPMPPARWSWVKMPQPCSKLSYVNFEQVGPYREIPAILPQRPGCLEVWRRVGSGGCWSFLAAREPLESPSPLTEPLGVHDSLRMQLKSLLASLSCLPTGLQRLWNQTQVCVLTNLPLGAMWHHHYLVCTIILMASFSIFLLWSHCLPTSGSPLPPYLLSLGYLVWRFSLHRAPLPCQRSCWFAMHCWNLILWRAGSFRE